jgi:purine nucleosidase
VTAVPGTHAGAIERKPSCSDGVAPERVPVVTSPQLRLAVQSRVVLDNDWSADPDGLVALAHHLLSPTNRVVAVTSSFINPLFGMPEGATTGAALARELVELIALPESPPVHAGSNGPFGDAASAAADAIVAEARRDDELPLFLVCAGPLPTSRRPCTRRRTSPRASPSCGSAALSTPPPTSTTATPTRRRPSSSSPPPGLVIWQFPLETYRRCACSVAELESDLGGSGLVGEWLWTRFTELPLPDFVRLGGVWPLGDNPPVLVTALDDESSTYRETPTGRVYTDVDVRLLFGDVLAKLRLHERRRGR